MSKAESMDQIGRYLVRRHSTAAVLFHHAVAERLGLGPTDLKCLDLLRDHGAMTGSDLAAITGLTTGAITGVVARLESGGFVQRAADPTDARKQVLSPTSARAQDVQSAFKGMHEELADLLDGFDSRQMSAIADFLGRSTALLYRQIGQLRAERTIPIAVKRPSAPKSVRR